MTAVFFFLLSGLQVLQVAAGGLPEVDLAPSIWPSAMREAEPDGVLLRGDTTLGDGAGVRIRVTTSLGSVHEARTRAMAGHFSARFPRDFIPSAEVSPAVLYVDATSAPEFDEPASVSRQSEITMFVSVDGQRPELPLVFMDDFTDERGRKDQACLQWDRNRVLANRFLHGRGAALMRIQKPEFDLANPADWRWFCEHATLFDFEHRDRDWSMALGHRVAGGFWNAVWPRWFNASNDHPWDGDPGHDTPQNYKPYTFTNDLADLIVLNLLNGSARELTHGATRNLLALQHHGAENFALREDDGRRECYTAGAFHYGMFNNGEWLTEGKGWFHSPKFRDFAGGGVFNGRAVWALGESLKAGPPDAFAEELRESLRGAIRFCLQEAVGLKYAYLSASGKVVWSRIDGEHAYLLMGMIAAYESDSGMQVSVNGERISLREKCAEALDALVEVAGGDGTWSRYGNANAVNVIALADGARVLHDHPHSAIWHAAAVRAADVWLGLRFLPEERREGSPLFSSRRAPGEGMTCQMGGKEHPQVSLYMNGHWLHALASMHALTGEARYRERAERLLGYFCGDNPMRIRLLNELGAVCNMVADSDGDGQDDQIFWNGYPESTAFVQIGVLHWLEAR